MKYYRESRRLRREEKAGLGCELWYSRFFHKYTEKIVSFIISKNTEPFIAEFIFQLFLSAFYTLMVASFVFPVSILLYCFVGSGVIDLIIAILLLSIIVPCSLLLMSVFTNKSLILVLMDKLTGKNCKKSKVSLTIVRVFNTSIDCYDRESDLFYIYQGNPNPCKWYYYELESGHVHKSSKVHSKQEFFTRKPNMLCKEKQFLRFIISEPKSELIDQLYCLEPTMEFEVSYLRFSKFLKEIRPIEDYEYAEGVETILNKINTLYP